MHKLLPRDFISVEKLFVVFACELESADRVGREVYRALNDVTFRDDVDHRVAVDEIIGFV